jgi:hypothetical protein
MKFQIASGQLTSILALAVLLFSVSCKPSPYMGNNYVPPVVGATFSSTAQPPLPDYSNQDHWAALPFKKDMADTVPVASLFDNQASAKVDVFFIHPTLYLEQVEGRTYIWNADINDSVMNAKVDGSAILNQASVFNGSCRVFAPRYRQAHITSFFTTDRASGEAALELAYKDVKAAFQYYLENFNQGRPFIIAGHSQGTRHGGMLIREMIEGKPLQENLIAAYLVGMPITQSFFKELPVCSEPNQTNCFTTWATYKEGFLPNNYSSYEGGVCVNPLSWKTNEEAIPRSKNIGGITWKYNKVKPKINGAQVHNGILWIDKPHVPGRMFIKMDNYHVADYNLFWFNLRENVRERTEAYLNK